MKEKNIKINIYQTIPEGCNRESQPYKSKVAEMPGSCGRQLLRWFMAETPDTWWATNQGGRYCMAAKAFTLIELLVVILIIGILSAIAVPQYRVSVAKSRFSNLQQITLAYSQAAIAYYMDQGQYPNNFSVLSVDIPGGNKPKKPAGMNSECMSNDTMYCCINGYQEGTQSASMVCGTADYELAFKLLNHSMKQCMVKQTWQEAVCKSLKGYSRNTTPKLQTPTGFQAEYITYTLP